VCLYLLCFVLFVLCFLYCLVYIYLFLFVTSVRTTATASENSIAVNNNNNNNNAKMKSNILVAFTEPHGVISQRPKSLYCSRGNLRFFLYFTYFLFGGQSTGYVCHTKKWLIVRVDVAISSVIRV
jgi:Ca2+/Na+ antiporter